MATAGYSQCRGVNNISTASYKLSSLGLYRVGSLDAYSVLGSTTADITKEALGSLETLSQFGGITGLHGHAFTGGFTLANWETLFSAIQSTPSIQVLTFSDALDYVRANDDHVTSYVSYACSDNSDNCQNDNGNFHVLAGGPGIDKGTATGLGANFLDYDGIAMTDGAGAALGAGVDMGCYTFAGHGANGRTQGGLGLMLKWINTLEQHKYRYAHIDLDPMTRIVYPFDWSDEEQETIQKKYDYVKYVLSD